MLTFRAEQTTETDAGMYPTGPGANRWMLSSKMAQEFRQGPPEIHPSEITKIRVLGDGSFGTVYMGRCRSQDVAVKVLHRQDLDEKSLSAFRKEVEIVSKIFHPNIVLYMGACTTPGHMMIITELMDKGDVYQLLHNPAVRLTMFTKMNMARDAAKGMTWLHGSDPVFVHRDMKTSNLLVGPDNIIKLCDFGLSQLKRKGESLMDGAEGAKGTPLWMAPEVMAGEVFSEKADIYSFGIVLWEILTREEPFQEFENFEEFRHAVCIEHHRPELPPDTHPGLAVLMSACWHPNPADRPTFPVIVSALDEIIVDCAIRDPTGRAMWKEHFIHENMVPSRVFLTKLLGYFPEEEPGERGLSLRCLEQLLVETPKSSMQAEEEIVDIQKFGEFMDWFGPMCVKWGDPLLVKVKKILRKRYFHGPISTRDAESRLAGQPTGTFLVRFSTSSPGGFTISKVSHDGDIHHKRIVHEGDSGKYHVSGRVYGALEDLVNAEVFFLCVQAVQAIRLKFVAAELDLISPAPGSSFVILFSDFTSSYLT